MPSIGRRCHELRVDDGPARQTWRIVYRLEPDAVVILEVFGKTSQRTPQHVIDNCRRRLGLYERAVGEE